MVKPKGLGRGLDALLSGNIDESEKNGNLINLDINKLQPGKYQPRTHMDSDSLQSLSESIKSQGIMQPILARKIDFDMYEIIAGERRWRASKLAGLEQVPVLIREIADEAALAMALIENIQRENLNPIEEAVGIQRLIDEFNMTHEAAAHAVGRSRSAVSNLLRLLSLHENVQQMLMFGKLDMGHARALISLSPVKQLMVAEEIVQKSLSVRAAEQLVKKTLAEPIKSNVIVRTNPDIERLQQELADSLGAHVKIDYSAKGAGVMKIHYQDLDQLDHIIGKLRN